MKADIQHQDQTLIAPKASIANPGYRVRLCPKPVVINEKGNPAADAFIIAIRFPRERTSTSAGQVPVVTGPGKAVILVSKIKIRGVPLC